jgi:hypothetical protein
VAPGGAQAEDTGAQFKRRAKDLDDALNELLTIPETPAAFALGVSSEAVAHPGTLRDAAAHVVAYVGPGGSVKPGFAAEIAPFRPLFVEYDIDQWVTRANVVAHLLDGFRVSLATAADPSAAAGADAPTLIAAGARLSIVDDRDYRNQPAFVSGVRDALKKCFPEGGAVKPGEGGSHFQSVPIASECDASLDKSLDALKTLLQTGHRLEIASALTVVQSNPPFSADWRGTRVWLAYDYAFGVGSAGAALEADWLPDRQKRQTLSESAGARVALGKGISSWSASAVYDRRATTPDDSDDVVKYGMSLAVKIGTLAIVRAGVQGTHAFGDKTNSALFLLSVATANDEALFSKVFGRP